MKHSVTVLAEGYSHDSKTELSELPVTPSINANCSCVLITGNVNVIVDTMTPWDGDFLTESLKKRGLSPDDINYVVCTHGHPDHTGNNNLFLKAKHIVGSCLSFKDQYFLHPFDKNVPYQITEGVEVISTPGHTGDDVSVVVNTEDLGTVVIAGDIFERKEDIDNPDIWRIDGGSLDPVKQEKSRALVVSIADYIIPGHGPMFSVTHDIRSKLLHKN